MSVVGFDVGSLTSYIGAAKGGGVEILANEVSDRCTPSCVAFNGKSRFLGSAAEQQQVTNVLNTVTAFSRLIGKLESDPIVQLERDYVFYKIIPDSQGRAAVELTIDGRTKVLLPEQILAMHLHKLAEVAESNLDTKVVDVVLGVPSYYTDRERRAFLDAARIAGLNCMRLVNETTAIGIAYGLTKKDLPAIEEPPRNVAFVSLGNSNLQVAIIAFNNGKMKVLSTACDPCLGGRNFDMCIFKHLVQEIEEKYKLKVMTNVKARIRLFKSCERLKKVMSTNSTEIPINVECLMNDIDVSCKMKREFFESLCQSLLEKVKVIFEKALEASDLKPEEIYSVELVGGGTRIPAVKNLVKDVFGKEGSTTLNADEAVARGCAFQAAICSPAFKVREFSIVDACPYAISLHWKPTEEVMDAVKDDDAGEIAKGSCMEVFRRLANFPASKQLKFYRKSDFALTASYSSPDGLHISDPVIGRFTITNVVPTPPDNLAQVRLKARVNSNGIFTISNAVVMERVEKEVEVPTEESKPEASAVPAVDDAKMDTDNQPSKATENVESNGEVGLAATDKAPEKPKTRIEKRIVLRPKDVPIETNTSQLTNEQLLEFSDFQAKLNQSDKLERERQHLKNALEEYVYEMRDKLDTCLRQYTTDAERESFRKVLDDTESWIYDEGEDAKRSVISERLNSLKGTGSRFQLRYTEADQRPSAINALSQSCEKFKRVLECYSSGDPKYEHLSKEDMSKVENALKDKRMQLNTFIETTTKMHPTADPTVFVADIHHAQRDLENTCNPIISKPKSAPPPPATSSPTEGTKAAEASTESANKTASDNVPNGDAGANKQTPAGGEDMDVD